MAWQITVDGHVLRERDVSMDDIAALEAATGETWKTLHPFNSGTIGMRMAACLLVRLAGWDLDAATKRVGEMKLDEFVDCLSSYDPDDDLPSEYTEGLPPVADGTSTDT